MTIADDSIMRRSKECYNRTIKKIKANPEDLYKTLVDLNFKYYEDDSEKHEEDSAIPKSDHDYILLDYFENNRALSEELVQAFIKEHESESCNYSLSRRFLKRKSDRALKLLEFGLKSYPTNLELLTALGFISHFLPITSSVIDYYHKALVTEKDLEKFYDILEAFYVLYLSGYYKFEKLQLLFQQDQKKLSIIMEYAKESQKKVDFKKNQINFH